MICKSIPSAGFGGAVNYVMEKEGSKILDSKDVREFDPKLVAEDFEMISKLNPRVKNPVVHMSVSFHKDDKSNLTDDKMKAIAKRVIVGMGFEHSQYIVVKHTDAEHPHFHIVTSRVDMDLQTVSDKFNFLRLNKLRIEIEKDYPELTSANGRNMKNINPEKLRGKDAVKYKIYNAIKIEIKNSRNIDELIKNLQHNHSIKSELKFKRGTIDNIEGVKFNKDDKWISGSKIDKSCSYLNLLKQMNENTKETKITNPKVETKAISSNTRIAENFANNFLRNKTESTNGVAKKKKKQDEELER